ncbi:MAG: hypothetical protein IKF78_05960 [Atopobiaceae bacterium]|nr:hypothetical protein [Atopobiaceae bacterium]
MGAVKLPSDGTICGTFSHMVKPQLAHCVSGRVRHLTGINDADLTCARPLAEVLEALVTWIGPGRVRMVTWSESDLKQIRAMCTAKGIAHRLPHKWLDIQRLYPRLLGIGRRRKVALGEAADWCGIQNDKASAHRALYDAQMTAAVFRAMASSEFLVHRARIDEELRSEREPCSANIGAQCDGLASLLAELRSQEITRAA